MPPTSSEPTAVFLFNYGGPKSLDEVEPFLFAIFDDPAIIPLPWYMKPFRSRLARSIARKRAEESKKSYAAIGGRSPLNEETEKQARALEKALSPRGAFRAFLAMRYAAPRSIDALREALDQPDRIDALFIQQVAQKKGDFLYAIGAEEPPGGGFQARPHAAADFLRSVHRRFRWIVADVPRGDPVIQRQVIEASTDIVLVTDLSLPGVRAI